MSPSCITIRSGSPTDRMNGDACTHQKPFGLGRYPPTLTLTWPETQEAKSTTHLKGMGKTPHVKAAGRPESVDPMQMLPQVNPIRSHSKLLRLRSYPKLMKKDRSGASEDPKFSIVIAPLSIMDVTWSAAFALAGSASEGPQERWCRPAVFLMHMRCRGWNI